MKGVILAGGLGTRLYPLTRITNKHLLPVYDRPMIFYPIEKLVQAGIRDIMVVTGGKNAGGFLELLKNGHEFGLERVHFAYQEGEGGIAEALGLAQSFVQDDDMVVILGDNIFEKSLAPYVEKFKQQKSGARILLKKVEDPERFGVAVVKDEKITQIIEKPKQHVSDLAVTGVYMFDSRVFDIIDNLEPSDRNELEITDVNNRYIEWKQLKYDLLDGWWTDAGTVETLFRASERVRSMKLQNETEGE